MRGLGSGTLTISQRAFAENAAAKFGVCSGRRTPLPTGLKLEKFDPNEPESDWPFHEPVGCLVLLANQTRPDIAYALRAIARYANTPKEVHCGGLRLVFWSMFFLRVTLVLLVRVGADLSW